jgi:hypothetical protein
MNVFEIVVFVSWVAALWGIISASRQQSSAFAAIGRVKWKWVVINICGLIPYLGIVTGAVYGILVFRKLPSRSKNVRQQFAPPRSGVDQNPAGYNWQPGTPAPQVGFAAVGAATPAASQGVPCSACGTSGRVGQAQVCFPCGGKGYV